MFPAGGASISTTNCGLEIEGRHSGSFYLYIVSESWYVDTVGGIADIVPPERARSGGVDSAKLVSITTTATTRYSRRRFDIPDVTIRTRLAILCPSGAGLRHD